MQMYLQKTVSSKMLIDNFTVNLSFNIPKPLYLVQLVVNYVPLLFCLIENNVPLLFCEMIKCFLQAVTSIPLENVF